MIICITGPTGVGKTDTSWALIERGAPMVFLDCDWFASRVPFSWSSESDVESVFQAIAVMLRFHVTRGITRFIVPITVEMALSFKQHRHYFEKVGLPVRTFQLYCPEEQLRRRISARDRAPEQKSAELEAIRNQRRHCSGLVSAFQVIDTSSLDERAVAEKIWSAAVCHE
jgi:dephospho-CoA kinase